MDAIIVAIALKPTYTPLHRAMDRPTIIGHMQLQAYPKCYQDKELYSAICIKTRMELTTFWPFDMMDSYDIPFKVSNPVIYYRHGVYKRDFQLITMPVDGTGNDFPSFRPPIRYFHCQGTGYRFKVTIMYECEWTPPPHKPFKRPEQVQQFIKEMEKKESEPQPPQPKRVALIRSDFQLKNPPQLRRPISKTPSISTKDRTPRPRWTKPEKSALAAAVHAKPFVPNEARAKQQEAAEVQPQQMNVFHGQPRQPIMLPQQPFMAFPRPIMQPQIFFRPGPLVPMPTTFQQHQFMMQQQLQQQQQQQQPQQHLHQITHQQLMPIPEVAMETAPQ